MRKLATVLQSARTELASVAGELAPLEARLLAQHAWSMSQEVLVKDGEVPISEGKQAALQLLIARRKQHEPISHILGRKDFWKSEFLVTRDVLTPRADSETIIETVLKHRPDTARPYRILDLGTGSGCLLISLLQEYGQARGMGLDCSLAALHIARNNADKLGVGTRADFIVSDWCTSLNAGERFDIIVANPPYIPTKEIDTLDADVRDHEPHLALDGGHDGLDCYRAILSLLKVHLAENALVVCETGYGQAGLVREIANNESYKFIETVKDLAGTERVVALVWK